MKLFVLKHADVGEVAKELRRFAGKNAQEGDSNVGGSEGRRQKIPGRIVPVPEAKTIIIRASGPVLDMYASLIEVYDVPSDATSGE